MRSITLAGRRIDDGSEAFVIAEIGHNHQGNLDLCKEMFRVAAQSGVDAVKLQKRSNRDQFTRAAYNNVYNSTNSFGETYGEHREFLEFGKAEYLELASFAEQLGVAFFATAFDVPSLEFLVDNGIGIIKIASGDVVNTPLLEQAAATGVPLIVSTGAATLAEVDQAYAILGAGQSEFALLQCTSGYPAQPEELNIRVIDRYRERYPDTVIGFSSHENGVAMPLLAYALGARIIEKHFTTDRTLKGTDQAFSLSPAGMARLCRDLKRSAKALGTGAKTVYPSERDPMKKQRKSIVAAVDLPAGTVLGPEHLAYKVPNEGLLPYESHLLIGRATVRALQQDEYIRTSDVG